MIARCAAAGCGGVGTAVVLSSQVTPFSPSQLANDASALYWSNFSDTAAGRGVMRLAK
jgi:hypothetical protein